MSGLPKPFWPPGEIRYAYLHWTAGDYVTTYPAYHVCVGLDARGVPSVFTTHDVRANMRDVRASDDPYAAHTAGRNSYALGFAICGMAGATPHDFGDYPLRDDLVALACATVADACAAYGIPVERPYVRSHAEAALEDGYFGCEDDERWDIARLAPSEMPLEAADATRVGDVLRARIAASRA
jgi:hypothetical protein